MALNKVMLIGNAGKDPEVRHLEGGSLLVRFSLATTERYKDKNGDLQELTEWHNIVCWRSLAERAEKFVKKGSQLYIEGRLRTRNWEDKNGQARYSVEIVADSIQILGRRQDDTANQQSQPNIQEIIPQDDGDLPF